MLRSNMRVLVWPRLSAPYRHTVVVLVLSCLGGMPWGRARVYYFIYQFTRILLIHFAYNFRHFIDERIDGANRQAVHVHVVVLTIYFNIVFFASIVIVYAYKGCARVIVFIYIINSFFNASVIGPI